MPLTDVRHWLNKLLGALPRAITGGLTSDLPRAYHDEIEMVFFDPPRSLSAQSCFERAASALRLAARSAETAYAGLKRDVRRIIFWKYDTGLPYNRFQLAVVVPPEVADESDLNRLAAWFLHVSDPSGHATPNERSGEFLASLSQGEAASVSLWLADAMRRAEAARKSPPPDDDTPGDYCPL